MEASRIESDVTYYGEEPSPANVEFWRKMGRNRAILGMTELSSNHGTGKEFGFDDPFDMAGLVVTAAYDWLTSGKTTVVDDGCGFAFMEGLWQGVGDTLEGLVTRLL